MDGRALVSSFVKPEIVGKGFVVLRRIAKRMSYPSSTTRVDIEQFSCSIAHLLCCATFGLVPLGRAEFVQGRFICAHTRVATDQMQLTDRHIQHSLVSVFQVQELL